ncbi:hypothetical protein TI39_contig4336g00002 [Zymoseptoria brevis]|uniref:Uncharacterized protein n=1 Tax=Zymoseptoria brevis TaxID=1047168 RepID=A0A0F4G7H4_9PEZI|nr:hypothetical protein TI39_contig4336g00002 [Zymoseptoria brevis]
MLFRDNLRIAHGLRARAHSDYSESNDSQFASEMNKDMLRVYENCSYDEVLQGKKMTHSSTWVRAALAHCAKEQISAHRLPQNSKELIKKPQRQHLPAAIYRTCSTAIFSSTQHYKHGPEQSPHLRDSLSLAV